MDGQLTSHHLAIMRRSLACGGIPSDQMAWILSEAARLLDERDHARSVIAELVQPMTDVRRLLNELYVVHGQPPPATPRSRGRRPRSSTAVHENVDEKM
jgi:hypothetical protein